MMNEFPTIHTNIWDAFWAVPVILLTIFILKTVFKLSESWFSTVTTATGLLLSIFISHQGNLPAGIFMGFFYGSAAMGTIYSVKIWYMNYRKD